MAYLSTQLCNIMSVQLGFPVPNPRVSITEALDGTLYKAELISKIPFKFTISCNDITTNQRFGNIIYQISLVGRNQEDYLALSATGWKDQIAYKGILTPAQIAATTAANNPLNPKSLALSGLPPVGLPTGGILFDIGDFIQVSRYTYIVTQPVPYVAGTGQFIVPVHRVILDSFTRATISVGQYGTSVFSSQAGGAQGVIFPLTFTKIPNRSLIPFATNYNAWDGDFELQESFT